MRPRLRRRGRRRPRERRRAARRGRVADGLGEEGRRPPLHRGPGGRPVGLVRLDGRDTARRRAGPAVGRGGDSPGREPVADRPEAVGDEARENAPAGKPGLLRRVDPRGGRAPRGIEEARDARRDDGRLEGPRQVHGLDEDLRDPGEALAVEALAEELLPHRERRDARRSEEPLDLRVVELQHRLEEVPGVDVGLAAPGGALGGGREERLDGGPLPVRHGERLERRGRRERARDVDLNGGEGDEEDLARLHLGLRRHGLLVRERAVRAAEVAEEDPPLRVADLGVGARDACGDREDEVVALLGLPVEREAPDPHELHRRTRLGGIAQPLHRAEPDLERQRTGRCAHAPPREAGRRARTSQEEPHDLGDTVTGSYPRSPGAARVRRVTRGAPRRTPPRAAPRALPGSRSGAAAGGRGAP